MDGDARAWLMVCGQNNLLRKFTLPDDDEFDKKLGTIFRVFEDSKKTCGLAPEQMEL